MSELEEIKARAKDRLDALTMPRKDTTGFGPPPVIVSLEHAEAERDLDLALEIAAATQDRLDWWLAENTYEAGCPCGRTLHFGKQVIEKKHERDQARADVLAARAKMWAAWKASNPTPAILEAVGDFLSYTEAYEQFR